MSALRECYMPLAGLGADIPIHVAENGYPTGPGRSYEEQAVALEQMVRAVHDFRGNYNVTDYRWFDLRDGDSSNPNFQQQFGIMRDDYTAKPAFETYRGLIAELACSDRTPPRTTITSARIVRRKLVVTGRSTDEGCSTGVLQALIARLVGVVQERASTARHLPHHRAGGRSRRQQGAAGPRPEGALVGLAASPGEPTSRRPRERSA